MSKASLRQKQEQSKDEAKYGCSVPFSRREFAMMTVIAGTVLNDPDILEAVAPYSQFETDEAEMEYLKDRVNEWLR